MVGAWIGSMTATAHHAHRVTGAVGCLRCRWLRRSRSDRLETPARSPIPLVEYGFPSRWSVGGRCLDGFHDSHRPPRPPGHRCGRCGARPAVAGGRGSTLVDGRRRDHRGDRGRAARRGPAGRAQDPAPDPRRDRRRRRPQLARPRRRTGWPTTPTPPAAPRTAPSGSPRGLEAHEQTRLALAAGVLQVEQAEEILRAIGELPADLDPDQVAQAEAHLIGEAQHHDANDIKRLGRRLLEVIDPDAADAHDAALLETRGARRAGRVPADHVGRRPRPGPRPVHPPHPRGRRPEEGPPGHRRPQTPSRHPRPARPVGGAEARTRADGPRVRRVRHPLPHRPAPEGRWPQRHPHRHRPPRLAAGWAEGRPPGHRADRSPRPGPPAGV